MELAQAAAQPSTVVVKFGAQLASTTRKPCDAVGRAHVEQTEWTLVKVWSGGVAVDASNNMAMKLATGVKSGSADPATPAAPRHSVPCVRA